MDFRPAVRSGVVNKCALDKVFSLLGKSTEPILFWRLLFLLLVFALPDDGQKLRENVLVIHVACWLALLIEEDTSPAMCFDDDPSKN